MGGLIERLKDWWHNDSVVEFWRVYQLWPRGMGWAIQCEHCACGMNFKSRHEAIEMAKGKPKPKPRPKPRPTGY